MANIIGQVMIMCLVAIISTSSHPLRDSSLDKLAQLKKNYVALEYKRRPAYDFGIGKRDMGLVRYQARPSDFDFGKHSRSAMEYPRQSYFPGFERGARAMNKRSGSRGRYNFGLGKRSVRDYDAAATGENPEYSAASRTGFFDDYPDEKFDFSSNNGYVDGRDDEEQSD